jgi:AraC-like DNA-binding protein
MEFHTYALGKSDLGFAAASADRASGFRLAYGLAAQSVSIPAAGSLIIALRQPVELQFGEQTLSIPRYGSYFVPATSRPRERAGQNTINPSFGVISNGVDWFTPQDRFQLRSSGVFIVLSASDISWAALSAQLKNLGIRYALPMIGAWGASRTLALWALRLLRRTPRQTNATMETLDLLQLAMGFEQALSAYQAQIERCPGRGYPQKLQVFRRLMRARQLIELRCTDRLSIEQLAACASYSRAHFLSIYRHVFDCTPHAQIMERRLCFAERLLADQHLTVREITLAAGFEDRSSFSRLFRRRFGRSLRQVRQPSPGNNSLGQC